MKHKTRGPGDERSFPRLLLPRQVVHPVGAKPLHQKMPCRMKADVIQPRSRGVITQQLRRINVRQPAQLQRLRRTQLLSDAGKKIHIPLSPFARYRIAQGAIREEKVAV